MSAPFHVRLAVDDNTSRGNHLASSMDLSRAWVDPGPSPAGNHGPYLKTYLTAERSAGLGEGPDVIVDRLFPLYFPGDLLTVVSVAIERVGDGWEWVLELRGKRRGR